MYTLFYNENGFVIHDGDTLKYWNPYELKWVHDASRCWTEDMSLLLKDFPNHNVGSEWKFGYDLRTFEVYLEETL